MAAQALNVRGAYEPLNLSTSGPTPTSNETRATVVYLEGSVVGRLLLQLLYSPHSIDHIGLCDVHVLDGVQPRQAIHITPLHLLHARHLQQSALCHNKS